MQTTDSMNLKLFEDSDPVLPEDFNANTQAIERALLRRAKIVTGAYVGNYVLSNTNNSPQTLTLAAKPILIFIYGNTSSMIMVQGASTAISHDFGATVGLCNVTWQGNSVSWLQNSNAHDYGCNRSGNVYYYVALVQES